MPGQNRTGPLGQGSRTGRGMGLCNTDTTAQNNQTGFGRGQGGMGRGQGGMGRGQGGRGRGFNNQASAPEAQSISKREELEKFVNELEAKLQAAKDELKNM